MMIYELQCIYKSKQSKSVKVRLMTKSKISQFKLLILDYKLVIEKILKLVFRQVLMIYIVYSAQN